MNISSISGVNFSGVWEPVKKLSTETGIYNKGKVIYTLYDYTYHPYVGESQESINKELSNHFWGRSFSLWDRFDGQHKADILHMNYVRIGKPIDKNESAKYLEQGFSEEFIGGVSNDEDFKAAYNNETYAPYDILRMSEDYVKEVAQRRFGIIA